MASGLITSLRTAFPSARISWLCEPAGAALLQHNPELHEVVHWPRSQWAQTYRDEGLWACMKLVLAFRKRLRERNYDLCLDAQGLLKSAVLSGFTGAERRIGLNSKEGGQLFMTEVLSSGWHRDISSEYKQLAKHITGTHDHFVHSLIMSDKACRSGREKCERVTSQKAYFVLCPFTSRPQKHWLNDHWQALVRRLSVMYAKPMVILGGPQDSREASQLAAEELSVFSLAGETSLAEASEIIRCADGVIGVDTGLTHMGIAHGVPTIALFGSTLPYENTGRINATVLSLKKGCSPCRRKPTCHGRFECMTELHPDMVVDAAKKVFH